MKRTSLIIAILSIIAFCGNAQNHTDYLNKAVEQVEAGNCDAAQMFYDVYKELTGNNSSWLEKAIKDCVEKTKPKTYNIGDDAEDIVGKHGYKIAYLDASGKHGFAVCEMGSGPMKEEYVDNHLIPTWSEFNMINNNNNILKLDGQYWTTKVASIQDSEVTETWNIDGNVITTHASVSCDNAYYCYGLGSFKHNKFRATHKSDILFIYRF